MSCAHSTSKKRRPSCACRPPCCASKRAARKSKPRNPASAGCSWNVTLSITWTGSTLPAGKRR